MGHGDSKGIGQARLHEMALRKHIAEKPPLAPFGICRRPGKLRFDDFLPYLDEIQSFLCPFPKGFGLATEWSGTLPYSLHI